MYYVYKAGRCDDYISCHFFIDGTKCMAGHGERACQPLSYAERPDYLPDCIAIEY